MTYPVLRSQARHASALVLAVTLTACAGREPGERRKGEAAPQVRTDAPGVRNAHALAPDPGGAGVLLFAGADASAVRSDLWRWSGARWEELKPPGDAPAPRTFPAVATDSKRGCVVVFGGNRVLFGSEKDIDTFLGDTWEWDGAVWKRLVGEGPSPRAEAAMAYDEQRGRVVLFGGHTQEGERMVRYGDTWEWDGGGWTLRAAAAPGRYNTAMAYDATRGRLVRFGGWDGERRTAETWLDDGKRWIQAAVATPFPRNHAVMAYDAARERVVLFGGHDGENVFGDLWEWDGVSWVSAHQVPIEARVDNGH